MSARRSQLRLLPTRLPAHVLAPVVRALVAVGITANMVTVAGVLGNGLAAYFIARGDLAIGGVVMLVASGLDMLDGAIARQTGGATKFGALFDSVLDRVSEAVVLFGIAWWAMDTGRTEEALLAFVALVGSMLVSYVRARAEGLDVALTDGLFRRQERVVLTGAGLVFGLIRPALWILAVLSCLTAAQRLYLAGRSLKLAESASRDEASEEQR